MRFINRCTWGLLTTIVAFGPIASCSDATSEIQAPDAASTAVNDDVAVTYSVVDLGAPAGVGSFWARAINRFGDVAGSGTDASYTYHAVVWVGTQIIDLGLINGMPPEAYGINDAGMVVGIAYGSGSDRVGYTWSVSDGFTILQYPGTTWTQAYDVNNAGVVVGGYQGNNSGVHAYSWTKSGGFSDLHPVGYYSSQALAISESGVVTGVATRPGDAQHAAIWYPNGSFIDLGLPAGGGYSDTGGWGINSLGVVVGAARPTGTVVGEPFRWQSSGGFQLRHLYGDAQGINDAGRVVGTTYDAAFSSRTAMTMGAKGGMQSLPSLPGATAQWNGAYAINSCGIIVGFSQTSTPGFEIHAVKWVPPTCQK